jgi:hypothetical protein
VDADQHPDVRRIRDDRRIVRAACGTALRMTVRPVVVPLSKAPQPTKIYRPGIVASIIVHAVAGVIRAHGR